MFIRQWGDGNHFHDEGLYETGYFDIAAPSDTNRVQYDNAIDACAAFIKHEIESIRSRKWPNQSRPERAGSRECGELKHLILACVHLNHDAIRTKALTVSRWKCSVAQDFAIAKP